MSLEKKIILRTRKRALRVKRRLKGKRNLPRVSVFRSLKHIYAQIVDDNEQKTLASCSTLELKGLSGDKKAIAHSIGLELANRAKEKGVTTIRFDRSYFLYHGRVKALAEGLREGGLSF